MQQRIEVFSTSKLANLKFGSEITRLSDKKGIL